METLIKQEPNLFSIKRTALKDIDESYEYIKKGDIHLYTQYLYYMDKYGKSKLKKECRRIKTNLDSLYPGAFKVEIVPITIRYFEITE